MKKFCKYYYFALALIITARFVYGVALQSTAISRSEQLHQLRQKKAQLLAAKQDLQFEQARSYSLQAVVKSETIEEFVPIDTMITTTNANTLAQN